MNTRAQLQARPQIAPAISSKNGSIPATPSAHTIAATVAIGHCRSAVFAMRTIPTVITATTAGPVPDSRLTTIGSVPNCTYAQASAIVIAAAGAIKQVPATTSPSHPARR
jgi:hypothetical protein